MKTWVSKKFCKKKGASIGFDEILT